jgi:CheY-like chemotaxis protein
LRNACRWVVFLHWLKVETKLPFHYLKDSGFMSKSFVVLLGGASAGMQEAVARAADMAGVRVERHASAADLAEVVESSRPLAVIISLDERGARDMAIDMRLRCAHLVVPVIGATSEVGDLAFEEAFAVGMDDVCAANRWHLGRRLRRLVDIGPIEMKCDKSVLIADDDRVTRLIMGRVFRDAGYAVHFADGVDDAMTRAADPSINVVVCSSQLDNDDGESLSVRAPRLGSKAAWIINTPPKHIPEVRSRLGRCRDTKIAVHDAFQSPATLLFVANELVNRPSVDGRKSERLLYGATVRFRSAGRGNEDIGYLYNISEGGVYVRTLAPPERWDDMWLELMPPRSDRLVHLEGTAVWARPYGPGGNATVPCGFGLEITGGSAADMLRYGRSYRTYLAERVTLRDPHFDDSFDAMLKPAHAESTSAAPPAP